MMDYFSFLTCLYKHTAKLLLALFSLRQYSRVVKKEVSPPLICTIQEIQIQNKDETAAIRTLIINKLQMCL